MVWKTATAFGAVFAALAAVAYALTATSEDASIGGGLLVLLLIVFGLPWSVAPYIALASSVAPWSLVAYAALATFNASGIAWVATRQRRGGRVSP
jgi:hypothetical protein